MAMFMQQNSSPLFLSSRLSGETGAKVHLKLELYSATGSYKDRMASCAVADAIDAGASKVVVTSSGNQGLAIASASRAKGLSCTVLSTEGISPIYRTELLKQNAELVTLPDMSARSKKFRELVADGYFPLSVDPDDRGRTEQLGKRGYEAIAYETVETLGHSPDFFVMPVCYGDGVSGILRGFQNLSREKGTSVPWFFMVRATVKDGPIAYSIVTDRTTPEVTEVESQLLGESIFLNNDEFELSQKLGRDENLNLEAAAAGPLIALKKACQKLKNACENKSFVLLLTAVNRVQDGDG